MTDSKNITILTFVGLAGSGKSSAIDYLAEKGYPKVYAGGFILQGLADQGLEPTQPNEKKYREAMRAEHGNEVFMKMCIEKMKEHIENGESLILLDGLYTWPEYKLLKHEFGDQLIDIAVVVPKHLRYERLGSRRYRPLTEDEVDARDYAEIENLEKGGPIAIADYFVQNDGDIEKMHQQIDVLLKSVSA